MRMAGYVRVSTPRQVEKGDSLAVQETRLREEAKRRGWTLTIYREEGISAKDDNRPAYQRMRADLEARTVTGLVATKLDRLWRSLGLAVNEIKMFTEKWGRDLVILDDNVDTKTASGLLALHTILGVAEFERNRTRERVTEGMCARADKGLWNGGSYPFGYMAGKTKGTLAVNPKAAKIVQKMFDLYLSKRSIRRVVHLLNADGIKAPTGGAWSVKTVRGVLKNRVYTGQLVYNKIAKHHPSGKTVHRPPEEQIAKEGACPGIIPKPTFAAAQKVLKAGPLLHPRAVASDYLLSGLVKCGRCGGTMTGYSVPGNGKRYKYYRCWQAFDKGKTACRGNVIRADDLEGRVRVTLWGVRVKPAELRAHMKAQRIRERAEVTPRKREVGRLESELKKFEDGEKQIHLAYETGVYGKGKESARKLKERLDEFAKAKEKMEADLAAAQTQLGSATLETFDPEHTVQILRDAEDVYQHLDAFEDKRSLLHNLVGEVRVVDKTGTVTLKNGWPFFEGVGTVRLVYNKRSRVSGPGTGGKPPPYTGA